VITTYEKGLQFMACTNTTASSQRTPAGFDFNLRLEPTHLASSQRTPKGFSNKFAIYGLHQHTQQSYKNLLRDLQKCSYGPTTTQQQAHKELLQDFPTSNTVMVL